MKRSVNKKIRGGALQFVVFTAMVIAILLLTFMSLSHTHTLFNKQTEVTVNAVKNIDELLLATLKNKDVSTDISSTIEINRSYWGIFEKISLTSSIRKEKFTKTALVGALTKNRTALYLKENNQPLVLVGNSKIEGITFLPKRGVRAGNISGSAYYGSRLIYGLSKTSREQLPLIQNTMYLDAFYQSNYLKEAKSFRLRPRTPYKNSFTAPIKLLYDFDTVFLTDTELIGNIVVQSENSIVVDATANLKDIILIAPVIVVKSGFKGSFQAIASERIEIAENCQLEYPSALVLQASIENNQLITIRGNTNVSGIILFDAPIKERMIKSNLIIDNSVNIYGEVYCKGIVSIEGRVHGSLFTHGFVSNTRGATYLNHIFNGQISAPKLTNNYYGLSFNKDEKDIVKWLY